MKKAIIVAALMFLGGCDYVYRYDCQDPKNFDKADCKPPLCEYEGECSAWLIGQKGPAIDRAEGPDGSDEAVSEHLDGDAVNTTEEVEIQAEEVDGDTHE